MKTISSKFKMHVGSVSIVNNNIEKLAFNIIFVSFGILALFYVLFLGNMVKNIIERRSLEADARTLASEVRDLELAYLNMSSGGDLSLSHSMGFKETQATFAT